MHCWIRWIHEPSAWWCWGSSHENTKQEETRSNHAEGRQHHIDTTSAVAPPFPAVVSLIQRCYHWPTTHTSIHYHFFITLHCCYIFFNVYIIIGALFVFVIIVADCCCILCNCLYILYDQTLCVIWMKKCLTWTLQICILSKIYHCTYVWLTEWRTALLMYGLLCESYRKTWKSDWYCLFFCFNFLWTSIKKWIESNS